MRNSLRAAWLFLLCFPLIVWATEIEVLSPRLKSVDEGYAVSADFRFDLSPTLEEAVSRGLALHFLVEFELTRERWYWIDQKILTRQQAYRLSYHALARQYRLANGPLHQSFNTLDEALAALKRLRNWRVADAEVDLSEGGFRAALRLRLDVSQMPRPFQIGAFGDADWNLSSDWKRWRPRPEEAQQ